MRLRVFITQPVARSAIERLRSVADVEWNSDIEHTMTKDELCAAVREHDILFCLLQDHVDRDVIAANADLRAIASMKITPEPAQWRFTPLFLMPDTQYSSPVSMS